MAINPGALYTGKIDNTDLAAFPYGKPQNITSPGDATGTPLEREWLKDLFGLQQTLLKLSGQVPSGVADEVGSSQYLAALIDIAVGQGHVYADNSVGADAVILGLVDADSEAPTALRDGMRVRSRIAFSSTGGAATLNITGLGAKTINNVAQVPLVAGNTAVFEYVVSVDQFAVVDNGVSQAGTQFVTKTAATSRANTTTLTVDPVLNIVGLVPAGVYELYAEIRGTSSGGAGGVKLAMQTDSGTPVEELAYTWANGIGNFAAAVGESMVSSLALGTTLTILPALGNTFRLSIQGHFTAPGGSSSVGLYWAQSVSDAINTNILKGGMRLRRIA